MSNGFVEAKRRLALTVVNNVLDKQKKSNILKAGEGG
jgi:hypothetical protein